ncbi:hypothetical protein AB0N93_37970 [Streptomyces sp. NPDC091267]|uniref:hypothetical protein n=1 Tax=Streptomyces sp. NPDC091267 TaxID=3155195 RepID=UPI0034289555
MAEALADFTGPEGFGGLVEDGDDAGAVRAFGPVGRRGLGREPVSESGDGLPGDREVFEMGLGLPQSALQFLDLRVEAVGQGSSGVLLDVECFEQGLDAHMVTAHWSRQVGVFALLRRRIMTWVIAR